MSVFKSPNGHPFLLVIGLSLLTGCTAGSRHDFGYDGYTRTTVSDEEYEGKAPTQEGTSTGQAEGFRLRKGQASGLPFPVTASWHSDDPAGISLNFRNAEVATVADAVIRDILGKSYSAAPGVQGRITLQTETGLSRAALILAFEEALLSNGVVLTEADGVFRLITEAEATALPTKPIVGLTRQQSMAGYGIHILPVQHMGAQRLAELVREFGGGAGKIQANSEENFLLLNGTGPERRNMLDLVQTFDTDWMQDKAYALHPLSVVDASTVVAELSKVLETDQGGRAEGLITFLPIERMNGILMIAEDDAIIDRAIAWAERLDQGSETAGQRLYTYQVQNGRAGDLANVIGGLFGATRQVISGPSGQSALAAQSGFGTFGGQSAQNGNTGGGSLGGGNTGGRNALGGGGGLQSSGRQNGGSGAAPLYAYVGDNLRIIADERNNALLILTTPQQHQLISGSLKNLDVPPLQVLIEASIIEVRLNDELRYGVQWFFQSGDFDFSLTQGTSRSNPGATIPGFSGVFDNINDARIVVSALDSVTNVEVLSSPQLMVLNNQTALLQVGDEVPVPSGSAVNLDAGTDTVFNQIDYRSTGIILKVTPRVNSFGQVLLDIEQEVSDVVETVSSGIDAPTVQQRRIISTVAVQSGETLALGGLIQRSQTESDTGVPILSKIPLLGNVFKNRDTRAQRSELLILVTPRVVGSLQQARAVTDELRSRMDSLRGVFKDQR